MTKLQKIVLIGARMDGQAGVVLNLVRQFSLYDVTGLIDDDRSLHGKTLGGVPVLGDVERFLQAVPGNIEGAHICIADNRARESNYRSLTDGGLRVVSIIHPSAVMSADVKIGDGVFIGPNAVVMNGVALGHCVTVNTAASIDHDNVIEDFANISPGVHTSGRVHVRRGAFLGTGSIVIPGITVGRDAYVAAGAVVTKDVPDGRKVGGVPARDLE